MVFEDAIECAITGHDIVERIAIDHLEVSPANQVVAEPMEGAIVLFAT